MVRSFIAAEMKQRFKANLERGIVSTPQFQSAPVDTCRLQKAETDLEADPGAYCVGYRSRSHQPNDEGGQSCQTDSEFKTANTR